MQAERLPTKSERTLLGVMIHVSCVVMTCVAVPLAMGSNIWPIAAIFWSVMSVPVALITGGLLGWMMGKSQRNVAVAVLVVTGIALAIGVGVVMASNR